ncbi:MAG: HAMP domain-containing sensor histidine kinase [Caldilineaceae bacterium]
MWGLVDLSTYQPLLNFSLFVILAAVSASATTSIAVSEQAGVTYLIGPAISIAAIPLFGIEAGILIMSVSDVVLWLIKPTDKQTWKKSWSQLAFNVGMHGLSTLIAGGILLLLQTWWGANSILGYVVPWFIAAYVFEELNFWLLAIILRLQHGVEFKPVQMWKEDYWATQIGVLVTGVGSAILAFAAWNYNWIGIVIFFLPIVLSAYAFRLYVRQMQAHLDNLEQIVADRTKELAERVEEVADLNRQKDAFLAVLSHDMITPLTSIQMYAEFLIEEPEAAMQNPHLAHIMLRSQQTVYNLVRNIVDLEKLNSGNAISYKKTLCDLTQIVCEAAEIVGAEAHDKEIELTYHPNHDPLMVEADYQQLQRVFLNLTSNAVKYTPTNGKVDIATAVNNGHAQIVIQDNGYGIAAEELPYIFDRFRRVDKLKDKAVGTGLGLAIVKALIEEHGGTIDVESAVGVGTKFSVQLPLHTDA